MREENKGRRILYLDILRLICIFFVIYNHTRSKGFVLYREVSFLSVDYWCSLLLSIICKSAVPIFFMISGVTLLDREESIKELYQKRVLKFVFVILLFTFLQYLRIVRVHPDNGFHLTTWLLYSYCGNIIEPYWFLKSYLSFLLILPIVRIMAHAMEEKHFYYLIGMKTAETIAGVVLIISGYYANLSWPLNVDIIFYPLIGYYLGKKTWTKQSKMIPLSSGILIICLAIVLGSFSSLWYGMTGEHLDQFLTVGNWCFAVLLFVMIKTIPEPKGKICFWLPILGRAVFGTYLIEDVVRNQFEFLYPYLIPIVGQFGAAFLFSLISTITGLVVIALVRLFPVVKKII